MRQETDP